MWLLQHDRVAFAMAGLVAACAIVSAVLVAAIRRWAQRKAILDIPNDRSSHATAMPRGGGLAIVAVTLPVLFINFGTWTFTQRAALAAVSSLVAIVSGIDDVRGVPSAIRFIVHLTAAATIVLAFGPLPLPFVLDGASYAVAFVVTILWIVGLTNAFNFMDGIDGIAGEQALISGIGFVIFATPVVPSAGAIGAAIAGGALGFLLHNWQPARIFMGDVGSAFIGFLLASVTVAASRSEPVLLLCSLLILWPFIFDTLFTFLRRLIHGEHVFSAHRSHLYQRLVQTGWSHRQTAIGYAALATIGLCLAVLVEQRLAFARSIATLVVVLMASALWLTVRLRESSD
jgi:UDP-N-acetylmuramyl pentapeptide phosphotransferase/UDP-N-acetylglucosamine-1-phosphate transferase